MNITIRFCVPQHGQNAVRIIGTRGPRPPDLDRIRQSGQGSNGFFPFPLTRFRRGNECLDVGAIHNPCVRDKLRQTHRESVYHLHNFQQSSGLDKLNQYE